MNDHTSQPPIPDGFDDPLGLFRQWYADAQAAEAAYPDAMTVATVNGDGQPAARMLLLKGVDERGFVFYTNTHSRKGDDLAASEKAALLFYWKSLERQIRIEGPVEFVSDEEADAYFASRRRESQIGAWASDQSRPLAARSVFEDRIAEMTRKFDGKEVPRPPHWRGYRVLHRHVEFWQERPYRLHERLVYDRAGNGWEKGWIFP